MKWGGGNFKLGKKSEKRKEEKESGCRLFAKGFRCCSLQFQWILFLFLSKSRGGSGLFLHSSPTDGDWMKIGSLCVRTISYFVFESPGWVSRIHLDRGTVPLPPSPLLVQPDTMIAGMCVLADVDGGR